MNISPDEHDRSLLSKDKWLNSADRVRALVRQDDLEGALSLLRQNFEFETPIQANELALLSRRLSKVQSDERSGTSSRDETESEKNRISQSVLAFLEQQLPSLADHVTGRQLAKSELKARAKYLRILKADIDNRLRVSIHNARFIDLGIQDMPSATHLPWLYKNLDSSQQFTSIEEAFEIYQRRILLLGAPGAGKSTTLLHIAQQLTDEAIRDDLAPIPLVLNLSKYQFERPASSWFRSYSKPEGQSPVFDDKSTDESKRDRDFEIWLINEFIRMPGMSRAIAQRWIEEGRLAILLDGLDEVNETKRAMLIRKLNATFLRDYPEAVVVVCSRIQEYESLKENKDTRLQLIGAIVLQPLNGVQINQYLDAVGATGLRAALPTDDALYQMAQTPLTLSMMTLAYGGLAPADIPANLPLAERRHHLMEAYVKRMLQRKERRDRGIPFDQTEDNDVPTASYHFPPALVNRYLGWLAICLSVRMRTVFSLEHFYSFLRPAPSTNQRPLGQWATNLAHAVLGLFGVLIVALSIMPYTPTGLMQLLAICSVTGTAIFFAQMADSTNRIGWRYFSVAVCVFFIAISFGMVPGVVSIAIASFVPWNIGAIPAGLIAAGGIIGFVVPIAMFADEQTSGPPSWNKRASLWFVILCIVLTTGCVGSVVFLEHVVTLDYLIGGTLLTGESLFLIIGLARSEGLTPALLLAGVISLSVIFQVLFVSFVAILEWYHCVIAFAAATFFALAETARLRAVYVGAVFSAVFGGAIEGLAGAPLGAGLWLLGCLLFLSLRQLLAAFDNRMETALGLWVDWITGPVGKGVIRSILNPVTLWLLPFGACLPWRAGRFFTYCTDSMLLKRAAGEFEFVHRMLRDYFALRDLQPRLRAADPVVRLRIIEELAFQGEAAIDTLAEFTRHDNPQIREVAIAALGRIASPEVFQHFQAAVRSADPIRRRAVLANSDTIPQEELITFLDAFVDETDKTVMAELINVIHIRKFLRETKVEELLIGMLERTQHRRWFVEQIVLLMNTGDNYLPFFFEQFARRVPAWVEKDLLECLDSRDALIRSGAVTLLSLRDNEECLTKIGTLLRNDNVPFVRKAAALALRRFQQLPVVNSLLDALSDKNDMVRASVCEALGDFRTIILPDVFEKVINALSDKSTGVRIQAAKAVAFSKNRSAALTLMPLLSDRSNEVRAAVVNVLGDLGDRQAVDPLIRCLGDGHEDVRRAAIYALGRLADGRAVEPLIRCYSDRKLRQIVVYSLESLNDRRAFNTLMRALADRSEYVRSGAADALGKLADERAVNPLIKGLADPAPRVRIAAATALARIGGERAREALHRATYDLDPEVQQVAKAVLDRIPEGKSKSEK